MKYLLLLFLNVNAMGLYAIDTSLTWKFFSKNYSIKDGLPSEETYDVVADDNGYLYLSTDRGLMRFNGRQFDLIPFTSGEISHTIFEFFKDEAGKIWCSTLDKGIYYLENSKLHPYKFNDLIIDHIENAIIQDFVIDDHSNIYFYIKNFGNNIGKIDASGNFCYVTADGGSAEYRGLFLQKKIIPLLSHQNGLKYVDYTCVMRSPEIKPIQHKTLPVSNAFTHKVRGIQCDLGEVISVNKFLSVFYTDNKSSDSHYFPDEILSLFLQDSALWVGTRKGLYYFPSVYNLEESERYFPELSFNGVTRDHHGGMWFASLQQGVFHFSSFNTRSLNFFGYIQDISIDDKEIVFTSRGQTFSVSKLNNMAIPNFHLDSQRWKDRVGTFVKRAVNIRGDSTVLCLPDGFLLYSTKRDEVFYDSRKDDLFTRRVLSAAFFRDTLWIGTYEGIYVKVGNSIEAWRPQEKALQTKISDIKVTENKIMWIATLGQGLYSYSEEALQKHPEIAASYIESLYADNENDIWICSNTGVFAYISKKWFHFTANNGLPSSYVNKVIYTDGCLYGLSAGNLFYFVLNKSILLNADPYIKLQKRVYIDYQEQGFSKYMKLTKGNRHFQLNITNPNFESAGYRLSYRLVNADTGWIVSDGDAISLIDITPDKHEIQVRYEENITPGRPYLFSITLEKEPKWTQTYWFSLLIFILGGLVTIPPGIYIFKGILLKKKLYYEKMLTEQRVLSAQLNPHFTYNALNAMQLLVYKKQWSNALAYNERLGKILRSIFQQSERIFISLEEDLKLIKEYMDLEIIRLGREINFTLHVGEKVYPEIIPVPPLLIQPLVENAIWHGKKATDEVLKVECVIENTAENTVRIRVLDDGNGFDILHGKTENSALKNMRKRIALLNASKCINISVEMFSPFRSDGNPGTETILNIHYYYEKESNHYR